MKQEKGYATVVKRNDENRLFTLSKSNSQKPQEIIAQLSASIGSASGQGSPVLESNGNPYALLSSLNQKLQSESSLWFANFRLLKIKFFSDN